MTEARKIQNNLALTIWKQRLKNKNIPYNLRNRQEFATLKNKNSR